MTADRASPAPRLDDLLVHAAWLRGLAAALVHGAADADDLVQDTWVAAMRNPPPRGVAPRAWLAVIARNLARKRFRGDTRRAVREAAAGGARRPPSAEELVARIEMQRRLASLVAELPEPARSIVILRYYEELDSAEIARQRGEPAGTVRWRLKQGLDALRARLDEQHGTRSAWLAVLAPLAVPRTTPRGPLPGARAGTTAATATTLGGLLVSTTSKVTTAAAIVIVLLGGVWFALRDASRPAAPESGPAQDAAAAEPLSRPDASPAHDRRGPRRAGTADSQPGTDARPPEPQRSTRKAARIAGRIVDEAGAPVPGASIRVDFATGGRTGGPDGRFAFDVELPIEERATVFEFRAPGRALRVLSKALAASSAVDLGDVKLVEGGTVAGRCFDETGIPVGGVSIVIASVPVEAVDAATAPRAADGELLLGPDLKPIWEISDPTPRGPTFTAAADGSFVLAGLPVGQPTLVRFLATGHRNASYRLTARADAAVEGVRIVLTRQKEDEGIEGTVLAPDSSPAPDLEFIVEFGGNGPAAGTARARTDGGGRFHLDVDKGTTCVFHVSDPARGWSSPRLGPFPSGRRDVVVRTQTARRIEIVPRGEDGTTLREFAFSVSPELAAGERTDAQLVAEAVGSEDLVEATAALPAVTLAPAGPFSVTVVAPRYAAATLSHLDAATSGDRIVVPLQRLPDYVGIVRSPAGAVAGATVSVFGAALGAHEGTMICAGFPLTRYPAVTTRAMTDEKGRYSVTLRNPGRYVLRAEKEGLAPAEQEFAVKSLDGGDLPGLDLTQGGTLEGTVRTGGSRSAQGLFVCASRGDRAIRSVELGPEGTYRFEGLTPGPWMLRVVEAVPRDTAMIVLVNGSEPIEWTCTVDAGRTTRRDLGFGAGAACTVRGRLRAEGGGKWYVGLDHLDVNRGSTDDKLVAVGPDGTYALSTEHTGRYLLVFSSEDGRIRVRLPVALVAGEVRVDFALSFGSVEVVPATGESKVSRALLWEGERGAFSFLIPRAAAGGRLVAQTVPAGHVRLVHEEKDSKENDPRRWPVDAEVDVKSGEAKVIELR